MCGLAVRVTSKEAPSRHNLQNVLECLAHRGPDDAASETIELGLARVDLCHTRLAVIDLSSSASQPFTELSGRWKIVFNGEIYNYLELRAELEGLGCIFQTDSDTEVLLWTWRVWGVEGLHKLRGMFAFAVVDTAQKTLAVVRDPFGIKPVYCAKSLSGWSFASELAAILKLTAHRPNLNHSVAVDFLLHGSYDRTSESFFDDVFSLEPGSIGRLDLSKDDPTLIITRWFREPSTVEAPLSWEDAQIHVRSALRRSVELHLRADVGLGVALSGGLDSSALTALVRDIQPDSKIRTFSFVIPGHSSDESSWSSRVAQHLKTTQHLVSPSANQVSKDIDDVVRYQGEPFGSLSIYAQYAVYREALQTGLTVVLDGQGGDEVFGGYTGYPEFRLRSLLAEGDLVGASRFLSGWRSFPRHSARMAFLRLLGTYLPQSMQSIGVKLAGKENMPPWVKRPVLEELGIFSRRPAIYGYPLHGWRDNRQLAKRLAEALFSGEMVNLLRHGDRNSMRWSIESRVPFLDVDLASLALSLPEEFLVSKDGLTKSVVRHSLRGLLPDDVLFRRDKVGFEAPDLQWLKGMAKDPKALVDGLSSIPWIDIPAALQFLNSIWDGSQPYTNQAWRLVNLSKWSQQNL